MAHLILAVYIIMMAVYLAVHPAIHLILAVYIIMTAVYPAAHLILAAGIFTTVARLAVHLILAAGITTVARLAARLAVRTVAALAAWTLFWLLVAASSLMSKRLLSAPEGLPKAALSQALHV